MSIAVFVSVVGTYIIWGKFQFHKVFIWLVYVKEFSLPDLALFRFNLGMEESPIFLKSPDFRLSLDFRTKVRTQNGPIDPVS